MLYTTQIQQQEPRLKENIFLFAGNKVVHIFYSVIMIWQHRKNFEPPTDTGIKIMTEQTHIDVVVKGFADGKTDDEILRDLFETGLGFNELRPVFNDVIKTKELRLSAKDRKAKADEILEGWTPVDAEVVAAKATELAGILKITDAKALNTIKAWAKANSVEMPKVERKPKAPKLGFGGIVRKVLDHILANRDATREDVTAFCEANEIPVKYVSHCLNIVSFAKEWSGDTAPSEAASETPEDGASPSKKRRAKKG